MLPASSGPVINLPENIDRYHPKWFSDTDTHTQYCAQSELLRLQERYKFHGTHSIRAAIACRVLASYSSYQEPVLRYFETREKIAGELGATRAQAMASPRPINGSLWVEINPQFAAEDPALGGVIRAAKDGYSLLTDPTFVQQRQQANEPDSISARVRREHPIKYEQLRHVRIPLQGVSSRFETYMDFSRRVIDEYQLLPKTADLDARSQQKFLHKQREMALLVATLADMLATSNTLDIQLNTSEQGKKLADARRYIYILDNHILWYYDNLIDGAVEEIQLLLGKEGTKEFIQSVNAITSIGAKAAANDGIFPEAMIQAFQKKYTAIFAQIEDHELIILTREWLAEFTKMARKLVRLFSEKIQLQKNVLHFSQEALALSIEGFQAHFDFHMEEVEGLFTNTTAYRWKRDGSAACDVILDEGAMINAACFDFLADVDRFNASETPTLDRLVTFYDRNHKASLETYWVFDKVRMASSKIVGLFNDLGSIGHEVLDNNALWIELKHSIFKEGKGFASQMEFYSEVLARFTSQQGYEVVQGVLEEIYGHFLDLQASCATLSLMHANEPAIQAFIQIAQILGGAPHYDWTLDATRYMGSGGPALLVGLLDAPQDWKTTTQSIVEQVIQPKLFPPTVQQAYRQIPYKAPNPQAL